MHDCALEQKRRRAVFSALRVEHTSHCSEISTKTTLQNQIKLRLRQVQAIKQSQSAYYLWMDCSSIGRANLRFSGFKNTKIP